MGSKPRRAPPPSAASELGARVRRFALALPGATEEHPWGERVAKVRGKVFVFLGRDEGDDGAVGFSVKLPRSGDGVLHLPFARPTGYGLGKSGWVSVSGEPAELPFELCCEWIEESYRAIAPRRLVAELDRARAGAA